MSRYAHTPLQRFSAAFLGLLLLSLYAVRLFHSHHHPSQPATAESKYVTLTKQAPGNCPICHFEVIREAALPADDVQVQPLSVFKVMPSRPAVHFYFRSASFTALRGPPAA